MSWSLSYQPPKEPKLLNEFFRMAGKALFLANAFEVKCSDLLRFAKLAQHIKSTSDTDATLAFLSAIQDKMLGPTISELEGFPLVRSSHIKILVEAKDARNYIAHEGALLGELSKITSDHIQDRRDRLRKAVAALVAGDNIVSSWLYEIEEREVAPAVFSNKYPAMIDVWIFGRRSGS